MVKKQQKKEEDRSGLFIPAGIFIGMGVGFWIGQLVAGLMLGLGIGFPVPENDLPFPSLRHCTGLCDESWNSCDNACYSGLDPCTVPSDMLDLDEINGFLYKCTLSNQGIYWSCKSSCDVSSASCYDSCKSMMWSPSYKMKPSEYKEAHSCEEVNQDGCCDGYYATELGVCCKDGFDAQKQPSGVIVCSPVKQELELTSVKVNLDKNTLLMDGFDKIKATFTFEGKDEDGRQ